MKKYHLNKSFLLLAVMLLSQSAWAIQKIQANPDEAVQIVASMTDANVISITGGSIESVWGTEDKVSLEANVDTGQAIFRPMSNKPFTLFVQSEAGMTYTLSVVPRSDIIGQVILLNEFDQAGETQSQRTHNIIAYKSDIKRLLKQIEQLPGHGIAKLRGFQIKTINKAIPLWVETKILHAHRWTRGSLIIDRYLLTNVSDKVLRVEEREFHNLAKHIRAISLRQLLLKPAETTVLYTFRSAS
jgi:conjugal transfer pilus assembly protein TraK